MEQRRVPSEPTCSMTEMKQYREAIDDLCASGAISECESCDGEYLSSYFIVQKKNGNNRFILNLKSLNKFIDTKHFKLEDLRTTIKLISRNCYMTSIDLKDAYFLLPICPDYRKFLRFKFQSKLYEFNVLPFGLSTAPFVFTKLMKPVMSHLRCLGHISTIYLDDICCIGQTYSDCLQNTLHTRYVLESLGFVINEEKSSLVPNNTCQYLGFVIDSVNFQVRLPEEKRISLKNLIKEFLKIERTTIRNFARLVGTLTAACPAVQYGWIYTKSLERIKYLALLRNDDYDSYIHLPFEKTHIDLMWWLNASANSTCPIRSDNYDLEIYTDASKTGWGVACGGDTASGQWSNEERAQHINLLELLAVMFGLQIFAKNLHDCQILLRVDNTTAVAYINRMGGVRFPHLNHITKCIWQFCEERNLYVFASYIASKDNIIADAESRRLHPDTEWQLSDDAFSQIIKKFGKPSVDLFASRLNNKCESYVSWNQDPGAYAINAFTLSWNNTYFYAFPPFSVILKLLRKIVSDKAEGIVVVPLWPTQPWYPLFNKLLISDVLTFQPEDNALLFPFNSHQTHPRVTLMAGRLSGQRS